MSAAFSHDLEWYLGDGWPIISAAYGLADGEDTERTFLVTVQKGGSVRVLAYEHFISISEDEGEDIDPSPYRVQYVKNLAG